MSTEPRDADAAATLRKSLDGLLRLLGGDPSRTIYGIVWSPEGPRLIERDPAASLGVEA